MSILPLLYRRLRFPLLVILIFVSLLIVWKLLRLPSQTEMIELVRDYFNTYGLVTVFISAIIEGLLLAGWYYPGSLVIFLGVIFAGPDLKRVALVVALVTAGLLISYVINFFLGKHGWYRLFLRFGLKESLERAETKLAKIGPRAIFMTYWQPNLAALSATAAGILRMPFKTFLLYSVLAAVVWNIFWGSVVYWFGETALSFIGLRFLLVAFTVWAVYEFIVLKRSHVNPPLN